MSQLFLSHSSRDNAEAVALRAWMKREGWDDVFLDVDPHGGIAAGERWERALNRAAHRCEAVLFLVSREWLASGWCLKEFGLAHRLNKRLFGILIEDIPVADLPVNLTGTWQLLNLAGGRDHEMFAVSLPYTGEEVHVTFSAEGLVRLRTGLRRAGLDPTVFAWPPTGDPKRPPYPGLRPLEAEDAGIFFGREAQTIEALDRLRALRAGAGPRLLCILGASGAGKSSFLRAGLWPRLARDDRHFLPLPVLRPERAPITGRSGLLAVLETACTGRDLPVSRADIREAVGAGAAAIRGILARVAQAAEAEFVSGDDEDGRPGPPLLVLPIDQGEELFEAERGEESARFLALLRELLVADEPALAVAMTIRSDRFEALQLAPEWEGIDPRTMTFGPMSRGLYGTVIEGPAARMREADRPLAIDPALIRALLADMEEGGARDALPLLAFTLERLWLDYGGRGRLTLDDYDRLGRVRGSIEAAVEGALAEADRDPRIPRDRAARLVLLRRGLVPWLAGIDPDTGSPRRRVARASEIPAEARPLIELLIGARLLAADIDPATGEATIEPAHEALLRQWGLLESWLEDDFAALATLEGVRRGARDWAANARNAAWLAHGGDRLAEAERLTARPDLFAQFGPTDRDYLAACRARADADAAERRTRARLRRVSQIGSLAAALVFAILGAVAWSQRHEAVRQRGVAEIEAGRARSTLASAKSAADGLIFDLARGLRGRGLPITIVRDVLSHAERLMERLIAASPNDPSLLRTQAVMYAEFATTYAMAGDTEKQADAADRALAITRRLPADGPNGARTAQLLAFHLATVGTARRARGDLPGALAAYEESLALRRRLVAEHPSTEAERDLSFGLIFVGEIQFDRGDARAALASFAECLGIRRRLAAAAPARRNNGRDLANALDKVGDAQRALGDLAAALSTFEESLAHRRRMAAAERTVSADDEVSFSLDRLAGVQRARGDLAAALRSYEESRDIRRRHAEADPANAWVARSLAGALERLGDVHRSRGDLASALEHYREALAIWRRLAASDPSNYTGSRGLARVLTRVGGVRRQRGEFAAALASFEEALAIQRRAAGDGSTDAAARAGIAETLEQIGDVFKSQDRTEAALERYEEAALIRRRLAEAFPSHSDILTDLASVLDRLGEVRRILGDLPVALASYEESLALRRKLAEADPSSAAIAHALSVSLLNVGDILRARGDIAAALVRYEEAIAIQRRLAGNDPSNADLVRSLAITLERIGDMHRARGDMAAAGLCFEESLAIQRRLVAADPSNLQAQRNISFILSRVGDIRLARRDFAGAEQSYEETIALRRRFLDRDSTNVGALRDLGFALERLGDLLFGRDRLAESLERFEESLLLRRQVAASNPPGPAGQEARRDLANALDRVGRARAGLGLLPDAWTSFSEALAIRAEAVNRATPAGSREVYMLATRIGTLAYRSVLAGEHHLALIVAGAAIEANPADLWLRAPRAHARMMLGEVDDARAEYLAHRGETVRGAQSWQALVLQHFAALRRAGLTHPLMDEVTAAFAPP